MKKIRRATSLALPFTWLLISASAQAANQYWDIDGATSGAGGTTPDGTWTAAAANWSTSGNGTAATTGWTNGNLAVFAAGTDATGAYTVTVGNSTTQTVAGISFQEGTVTIVGGNAVSKIAISGTDDFDLSGVTATIGCIISESAAGKVLTKSGSGTLVITNNNIFSGGIIVSNGVLSFPNEAGSPTAGNDGPPGLYPAAVDPNYVTIYNNATLRATRVGAGVSMLYTNRGITLGAGGGKIEVTDSTVGNSLTYFGVIAGAGQTLTKIGPGELRVFGSNTFSKLVVSSGRYRIGNTGNETGFGAVPASETADAITLGSEIGTSAAITLHTNRGITLGVNGGKIVLSAAMTIPSVITGPGTFTKYDGTAGAQTLTLSGANTYSALTIISNGIVKVQHNTALGTASGATIVNAGSELQISGNGLSIGEPISSLNGSGVTTGGALRNLANNNTWSGAITLGASGARINSDGGALTLAGPISGADRPLTLGGAGNINVDGVLSTAAGTLTKDGDGTVTLAAANTYTGTTTVTAGKLVVNGSIASTNVLVNAKATLGGNGVVAGSITANNGNVAPGSSAGTLTGQNGLNLSVSGTLLWEFSANSTNSPGTNFDQLILTGGDLVLGGTSRLAISFIGAATTPNASNPFWCASRSWRVISLSGTATNSGGSNFAAVINGSYAAGTFSTSVNANGEIVLTFTPIPPPPFEIRALAGAATTNVLVSWGAECDRTYQVQYNTNLNTTNWFVVGTVTATNTSMSLLDNPPPDDPQRYYRVLLAP